MRLPNESRARSDLPPLRRGGTFIELYFDEPLGIHAPKGLESLAQGLPWVGYFAARPHKALPSSALLEKHPSAGLEVLKGQQNDSTSKSGFSLPSAVGYWRPYRARSHKTTNSG
jgi:hypothetical protein